MADEKDNLIITLEPDLKTAFKAKCAQENITMREVIIAAIQNFVNGKARRRSA